MISVLIPVFNYNVVSLVTDLHKQLLICKQPFEIICFDDHSSSEILQENQSITTLAHTSYETSNKNLGRIKARQELAEMASYEWLLFLDADVIPKNEHYIQNYLNHKNSNYDAIYGGLLYHDDPPQAEYRLRWKYGTTHEQINAEKRNQKKYKTTVSANFMIKRSVFTAINSRIKLKAYGQDNYFAALLKSENINVFHIDNEVYHLGIETSATYLRKKELAAETLLQLYNTNQIATHQNDLLRAFIKLRSIGLHRLLSMFYKLFHEVLRKNLLSSDPSMRYFQLYRLSYMCYKDLNKA